MSTNKDKPKKGIKGAILTILIIFCALVVCFALYKIISIQTNYKKAQNEYSNLRQYTVQTAEEVPEETVSEPDSTTQAPEKPETTPKKEKSKPASASKKEKEKKGPKAPIEVDHESLLELNSDYIGWLYIESLNISYPIMRGEDDEFYLHHTFNKDYLFSGSLFINSVSTAGFKGPHAIIYGHNMKDLSMFGTLRLLYDQEIYKTDPYFWVLTPEENLCYRIFSLYVCNDNSQTYTLFSGPGQNVADYIMKMRGLSWVDTGELNCDNDSRIVTLSTCVAETGPERFVVQGILEEP